MNFDQLIMKLKSQSKEIQEHQNELTGIGQAFNEMIAPMGLDKIEHKQFNNQPSAMEVTKKDWNNNKN